MMEKTKADFILFLLKEYNITKKKLSEEAGLCYTHVDEVLNKKIISEPAERQMIGAILSIIEKRRKAAFDIIHL